MRIYFQNEGPYSPEKVFKFNGGEMHVKLGDELIAAVSGNHRATVFATLRSSDDIMSLLLFTDAIKRVKPSITMNLIIPYLPYARQDRVCVPGEALSVRVMADVINTMGYDEVIIHDAHSDVGVACLDSGVSWPMENLLAGGQFCSGLGVARKEVTGAELMKDKVLVAPDAGAMKKVHAVAQRFGIETVVEAGKHRDVKTGNITGTYITDRHKLHNQHVLIVDDICDGGMTFIKLAEKILQSEPKSISLYVSHGIFSKGKGVLFDAGIDKIYTTDSFPNDTIGLAGKVFVLKL